VKYAHDLLLLPKEEMVIHGMIYRLTEVGWYYGIEMNVEKLM
jgi:hypothetical protein